MATLRRVTPAQASSACRSRSPEQASLPLPPVARCRPARTGPANPSTVVVTPSSRKSAVACNGVMAAAGSCV